MAGLAEAGIQVVGQGCSCYSDGGIGDICDGSSSRSGGVRVSARVG